MLSHLICVTDRTAFSRREDFYARMEYILSLQPKAILLREKDLDEDTYTDIAEHILYLAKKHNVLCILHQFLAVARLLHADAIHLPLPTLRQTAYEDYRDFSHIGTSCHTFRDVEEAKERHATYAICGHIYETPSKAGLPPRGLSFLRDICQKSTLPIYAIGGITPERMADVLSVGAKGICARSTLMQGNIWWTQPSSTR